MPEEDEFVDADETFDVVKVDATAEGPSNNVPAPVENMLEHRRKLIRDYHEGAEGLIERLHKQGKEDYNSLLRVIIEEVIKETDNLLGNELIATRNGALRDATIISSKRAEVLERVFKTVQSKQTEEHQSGVNVESPSMLVIFKYFMEKAQKVLFHLKYSDEQRDVFFRMLGDELIDWKREVKEEIEHALKVGS